MEKASFTVSESEAGQSLFKYLKKVLSTAPLAFIYRLLRKKDVRVNDVKVDGDHLLEENDLVTLYLNKEQTEQFIRPYKFFHLPPTFQVVYEDENVLLVDKPRGLIVHSSTKEKDVTLANMVLTYLEAKGEFSSEARGYIPSPVARIDEDTAGIVLFSKKLSVHQVLATAFTSDSFVNRMYRLVVYGIVKDDKGTIELSLAKTNGVVIADNNGKKAKTVYHVLKRGPDKTYLEAHLLTGRQHQIRVHFASLGFPLVGDQKYGKKDAPPLALNAYSLSFNRLPAPLTYLNGLTFTADHTAELLNILGGSNERN